MKRAALFVTLLAFASLGLATPVLAAAPGNDLHAGRTVIPATPFTDVVDTTGATSDADDVELVEQCGAPVADASVWYEFTRPGETDAMYNIETFESDYPVGIIVATGAPGSFVVQGCGPGALEFPAGGSETYTILLFDFQGDGGGNGGVLSWRIDEAAPPPPAPELEVVLSPSGSFDPRTGIATVRGTATCTGGDEFGKNLINLSGSQLVGRFRITGDGFATFTCDGTTQAWAADVISGNGKFGGGKLSVSLFAMACNEGGCAEQSIEGIVTLRR